MSSCSLIVYKGSQAAVAFAGTDVNKFPARDFLTELRRSPTEKRRHDELLNLIERFCDFGMITNPKKFRKLSGVKPALFEFKCFQVRVMAFYGPPIDGRRCLYLTHGFTKKSDKTPQGEIERAAKIRSAFESLVGIREKESQ